MNLAEKNLRLAQLVNRRITLPPVIAIVLPALVTHEEVVDEFGFVILQDGSIGPFYTSLDDSLHRCHQLYPQGQSLELEVMTLIARLNHAEQAHRAIAVGAFNALSQHLFRCAGFNPPDATSLGSRQPQAGETIAMVGYFQRLIRRLRAQNIEVLVLEKNPARVKQEAGVKVTTDARDLAHCQQILCTASTLINGSLESLLAEKSSDAHFDLIGPSGSGLPDVLFELGVDSVGGVRFSGSAEAVIASFNQNEDRGKNGQKYQLTGADYPGVESLLKACQAGGHATVE